MPPPTDTGHLERLVRALRSTAREVVPWFEAQMPESYFRDTDERTVVAHLAAVVAARISGASPRILLRDEERETWTFIQERSYRGVLSSLLAQLPSGRPLASAKVHTAADDSLILDVFRFGDALRFEPGDPALSAKLEETLAYARGLGDDLAPSRLPRYLSRASADFVRAASPLRLYETWQLVEAVEGTDAVACAPSLQRETGLSRVSIAAGNADTQGLFERAVHHLGRLGYDITRAFLDVFDGDEGWVSSLGFVVHDPAGRLLDDSGPTWTALAADLARLPWLDDQVTTRLDRHPEERMDEAEALVALSRLAHVRLGRFDPHGSTRDRLEAHLDGNPELARAIARLFLGRECQDASEIAARVEREVETEQGRRFFDALLDAVRLTIATNLGQASRMVLALRIDPEFFQLSEPERPYGIVFVHGRQLDGFHVRFADVARGGVRLVWPKSEEQHILESERQFDEVLGLAEAQHLKNKDIPEGGAKAVVLIRPAAPVDRSVRAFMDGLLDLSLGTEDDFFLGPDENISSAAIAWAVHRAEARGHPRPGTFMSSQAGTGIDHRKHGVTSEGITVFLEEALRAAGIDPRHRPFTVKMTGGPDGDVAGNQIRILHREFGALARFVGIADGSGAAWDPAGLDHGELLRLVDGGHGIARFHREHLGPGGGVRAADDAEGQRVRTGLCFELEADAFVPAGGRPATLHGGNWQRFLRDGRPTARVIVEGANMFLTAEARSALSERGVLVVKDSSANKCGVIASSLEVAANLLLPAAELSELEPRLAAEVLVRLRDLARAEAHRLFADYRRDPSVPLPDRSEALSRAILAATDAAERRLDGLEPAERSRLDDVVRGFLPPLVVERAGHRIPELPRRYRDRVIATRLGADLVYREGVEVLAAFPGPEALGAAAIAYRRHREQAAQLGAQIRASGLEGAATIATLLEAGAPRAALFGLGFDASESLRGHSS